MENEREREFAEMGKKRKLEIENPQSFTQYRNKIKDISVTDFFEPVIQVCEDNMDYNLPFRLTFTRSEAAIRQPRFIFSKKLMQLFILLKHLPLR